MIWNWSPNPSVSPPDRTPSVAQALKLLQAEARDQRNGASPME